VSILIGSSGFVGGHLSKSRQYGHSFNRKNILDILGMETDLLVCAGLPGEKWKANADPQSDLENIESLMQTLQTVSAERAILISTIDVFANPIKVNEDAEISLSGPDGYGRNRALFEIFFRSNFSNHHVIRLPGLIASDLRKNFIFDLINNRKDQYTKIDFKSEFQFFNMKLIQEIIDVCWTNDLRTLNVAAEPIRAGEIARKFSVSLESAPKKFFYDMTSKHAGLFNRTGDYLYSREEVLNDIESLSEVKR
jgi:nucleoside-diphosphate-sugar epimerase